MRNNAKNKLATFGIRNQLNATTFNHSSGAHNKSEVYSDLFTLSKPTNQRISSLLGSHYGGDEKTCQEYLVTGDPESGTNIELRPTKSFPQTNRHTPDISPSRPERKTNKSAMFEQMKNRLINIVLLEGG